MKKFVTEKGKEITSYPEGRNYRVKFTSGGELPEQLSGIFTDQRKVEEAINIYLGSKAKNA